MSSSGIEGSFYLGGGGRNSGNRLEGLRNKPALCSGLGWGSRRVALGRPCLSSFLEHKTFESVAIENF